MALQPWYYLDPDNNKDSPIVPHCARCKRKLKGSTGLTFIKRFNRCRLLEQNSSERGGTLMIDFAKLSANKKLLKNYTLHSGGANGGDTAWNNEGYFFGVKCKHYYYGQPTPLGNIHITKDQFNEGWEHVLKANESLNRQPGSYKDLLSRNWWIAKNATVIFAIAHVANYCTVAGGTGWAVQMAIDEGKPVFVFDELKGFWLQFSLSDNVMFQPGFFVRCDTPILTKDFAGIGTRELTEAGKQAIKDVYAKTIQNIADSEDYL